MNQTAENPTAQSPEIPASNPTETKSPVQEISSSRLVLILNDSGEIDFGRLPEKTRDSLKSALHNPDVRKELGIIQEKSEKISGELGFDDDDANGFLDLLQGIDSFAASKIYGLPKDLCDKAYEFKDYHRKKINPRMIGLLNKWSPVILKNWKDEIGFAIVLTSTINAQVRTMHQMAAHQKALNPPPPNVTPISGATLERAPAAPAKQPEKTPEKIPPPDMLEAVGWE
jgi:hypothetical protein